MANVTWQLENALGQPVGPSSVDEDQDMKVPHGTDPSGTKRAGDLVAGDHVHVGRASVYVIASVGE